MEAQSKRVQFAPFESEQVEKGTDEVFMLPDFNVRVSMEQLVA